MFNDSVTLVKYEIIKDKLGQEMQGDIIENEVLCEVNSIGSTEFYNANVSGYRPELTITINKLEYNDEEYVIYKGVKYRVIRTYLITKQTYRREVLNWLNSKLELTVGREVGGSEL